jgi:hypothetical protein
MNDLSGALAQVRRCLIMGGCLIKGCLVKGCLIKGEYLIKGCLIKRCLTISPPPAGPLTQYLGAALTELCGVTDTDYGGMWLLYLARTLCKLLPIPLVLLVPTEVRAARLQPRRTSRV